ncbi:MAG TPA: hypothetical protein ENN84_09615 [Candidatus Marinimicrobia bacterium]|nr:hypothetical protein [Candidatus Neomarinimicrobiota bacterium]
MLDSLLFILSLYPWNSNISAYSTIGAYSSGTEYQSTAIYAGFDRRGADQFYAAYETLKIGDGASQFEQKIYQLRSLSAIHPYLWLGASGAVIQTPGFEDGWLLGAQWQGWFPWLGISAGWNRMNLSAIDTETLDTLRFDVQQGQFGLSRMIGKAYLEVGLKGQQVDSLQTISLEGALYYTPMPNFTIYLNLEAGENRFAYSPAQMLLNTNPDILKGKFGMGIHYKPVHWLKSHLFYSSHNYLSKMDGFDYKYTVDYLGAGISLIF